MLNRDYRADAASHEPVFRNILRIKGLETQASVDEIYSEYSTGDRHGKLTIMDFRVGPYEEAHLTLSENEALFVSQDIATLSGSGSEEKYRINPDGSVELVSRPSVWMSMR